MLMHNKILWSLSDKERLLFKEHIMAMDRKVSLGLFRLTYLDEMADVFIKESLSHLEELQDFVDIYKIINSVIVRLIEDIANSSLQNIVVKSLGALERFKRRLKESRNAAVLAIGDNYRRIIEYIIVIYDGFESHLNTTQMAERWTKYIRKIDGLAEYAMLSASRNTLVGIYELLNGRNNMKPDPIIGVEIKLKNRKIVFQPSLEEVVETVKHIHHDLVRSVKVFPRLLDKFRLPMSNMRQFYEVISEDVECKEIFFQINLGMEMILEKVNDYIETWLLFRIVWEIEVDKFMEKFEEKGLDLKEFESSMAKYYDVANQVMMQDTTVVISFLTLDCTKLKAHVLEYIEIWKKGYKQALCITMIKKLEKLNETLTTRIKELSVQPTNAAELKAIVDLHDLTNKQIPNREVEMNEIREYQKFLGELKNNLENF